MDGALSLSALADLGRGFAAFLLGMTAWTLVLFAGARLADLATRGVVAARWRILYYAPVPVRLLLPVVWAAPLALGEAAGLGGAAGFASAPLRAAASSAPAAGGGGGFDAFALVLPLHLLVAALLALRWRRAHRRLLLAAGAGEVGPAVVGVLSPRIVLPRGGLPLEGAALAQVVGHEQAHLDRRDPLVSAGMRLLCVVLWPVFPLALAARRVRLLMEIACDDRALAGAGARERKLYMRTLCSLSLAGSPSRAPAFAAGRSLTARLREAARPSRAPAPIQAAVALLLPALLLGCAGLGGACGASDPVDYVEILPYLTRDNEGEPGKVGIMSGLLVADEPPDLAADRLVAVREGAWIVEGANASALFPSRDFTVVGSPVLVLLPDESGSITLGDVGDDGELRSGFRLEVSGTPEGDAVRLSLSFVQKRDGATIRSVPPLEVVVPERDSLFLATGP